MRLESARALKQELLSLVVPRYVRRVAALAVGNLAVAAQPLEQVPGIQGTVALGVARRGKRYVLAVRIQRQQLRHSELLDVIRKKAAREVDVRMVGSVVKRATSRRRRVPTRTAGLWYQANVRPLLIGASTGHYEITAGTLGAFVKRNGVTCILSNNHVLANEDKGAKGDPILQRAAYDGGRRPREKVAELFAWERFAVSKPNAIDAALAEVDDGIEIDAARLRDIAGGSDRRLAGLAPDPVDVDDKVFKIGRTTGPTAGRITAFDLDNVVVEYDRGNLRFDNQIEIEGVGTQGFSDGGDSGSLIVNGKMEAIGLLFAGSDQGGANGQGLTFACPIDRVLADLKATLIT